MLVSQKHIKACNTVRGENGAGPILTSWVISLRDPTIMILGDAAAGANGFLCIHCISSQRVCGADDYDPIAFTVLSTNATHSATSSITLGESCSYSIDITP